MTSDTAATGVQTVRDLHRVGQRQLSRAGIEHAAQELTWILEAVLGCNRLTLMLEGDRVLSSTQVETALALLRRRAAREPLQYVLGTQEFCGRSFTVTPAVLIPRPETEILVEEAIRHCRGLPHASVAEIGTGSGCVAVVLAQRLPDAQIWATDCSREALDIARNNAAQHGVGHRITFAQGDGLEPLRAAGLGARLSAIVCNPPYIPDHAFAELQPEVRDYEPWLALAGGPDGLTLHRRLVTEAPGMLAPGGVLMLEVGLGQAETLRRWVEAAGRYDRVWTVWDPAGIERVVCLQPHV